MKLCSQAILVLILVIFSACSFEGGNEGPLLIFSRDYDFNESQHEWIHGFAEYPAGPDDSTLYQLKYAYTDQVVDSKLTKKSVMLSGKNLNRDLFMFLKKKITGLKPNTDYTLTFTVELASEFEAAFLNAGGSVYLKAGAVDSEPEREIRSGNYVMNIDKGNQETAGTDMTSLGEIVTSGNNNYTLVTRNNAMANSRYVARSNSAGELWLIIGTDSNLEATTTVFYTRINVVFSAS